MNRRDLLLDLFSAAVRRVDPGRLVGENLPPVRTATREADPNNETKRYFENFREIIVISFGKAAYPMAVKAAEKLARFRPSGLVAGLRGTLAPLDRFRVLEAGHPVPDQGSVAAAGEILALAGRAGPEDLVLCLISGGGSALVEMPETGLDLADLQHTTRVLLGCGAEIREINCVRKHLSAIKGGKLARAAYPARIDGLVLSDVVGDPLDMIASGPAAPDPTTFGQALEIVKKYNIHRKFGPKVISFIEDGAAGRIPETPKPGDPVFERVVHRIVGNAALAAGAACERARELGLPARLLSVSLTGEARAVARDLAALAREVSRNAGAIPPPAVIVADGETTVTVRGRGRGGRNQELALAFLDDLLSAPGPARPVSLLSAGTDGIDGPTDAAGAIVTPELLERVRRERLHPGPALAANDSHGFLGPLGALIHTGPTGTNVGDLILLRVE